VVRDLPVATGWPLVVAAVAVLTMTWGYLAALVQDNAVRLLAYSSIAQAGYFLLGVVAVGASPLALTALIVFAAAYAAMNLGAFAVVQHTGRQLESFKGMGRASPLLGVAMVIFLLSLTGIPPLAGFTGKFLLFGAAIDAGFTWLTVVAILNSVLSLAVYLRFVVPMYQTTDGPNGAPGNVQGSPWVRAVWLTAMFATLAIGVAAQGLIERIG
jgi:NADH-quinone oxidoreductase subunit N